MNRKDVQIGGTYTYYPTKKNKEDNFHPRCTVDSLTKSGRVRIKIEGFEKMRSVSARSLSDQVEMFGD